jgi:lipopolysaccharide/colanic/teichoic acid biosynthesis glycosyltransferase
MLYYESKRILDVLGGALGLLLFLILFPFVAIAIKLDSRGPIIFTQTRRGKNGKDFTIYKFRSMQQDAEAKKSSVLHLNEAESPIFKIKADPRNTRVGTFLRRTSIDEIPQFWNVVKGDMSLVGPRPLPTKEAERVPSPYREKRETVTPGLTCLWQIAGRSKLLKLEDWIKLDMEYIDSQSLKIDIIILLRTIKVVIKNDGAH